MSERIKTRIYPEQIVLDLAMLGWTEEQSAQDLFRKLDEQRIGGSPYTTSRMVILAATGAAISKYDLDRIVTWALEFSGYGHVGSAV